MGCSWSGSREPTIDGTHGSRSISSVSRSWNRKNSAGHSVTGRLYCTPRALWKLNWFLRDFGYDTELLGRDEIDEKSLVGLRGVVKISHAVVNGTSLLNLDGFAPASQWEACALPASAASPEVAR